MDQLLPVVYMIGVLLLVLPGFLQSNSKLKQFLTNLSIWIIVVLIILTIIYIFKKWKNYLFLFPFNLIGLPNLFFLFEPNEDHQKIKINPTIGITLNKKYQPDLLLSWSLLAETASEGKITKSWYIEFTGPQASNECENMYTSAIIVNIEQLKKYKPTELAPGVKKKTN